MLPSFISPELLIELGTEVQRGLVACLSPHSNHERPDEVSVQVSETLKPTLLSPLPGLIAEMTGSRQPGRGRKEHSTFLWSLHQPLSGPLSYSFAFCALSQ